MSQRQSFKQSAGAMLSVMLLLAGGNHVRAQDADADLRQRLQKQQQQLQELQRQISALRSAPAAVPAGQPDNEAVKNIVSDYLKDNPGAGMPAGVQTGYSYGQGFVIRSARDPKYTNWQDDSKIPFELRIKGRLMLSYMNFHNTDTVNHQTNLPATQNSNSTSFADFSQLEVKRANLIFTGSAFDPDLHYLIDLLGSTRGLPGVQNNKVVQSLPPGGSAPNGSGISPIGGGVLVDNAVTLFEANVSYDFHGCRWAKGCGPECPDGTVQYCPTYTLIAGKLKPFFGLEDYLRNGNQQFVEFAMANWFFNSDDDTRLFGAGAQVKAFDDRLFVYGIVTNGSEGTFQPNVQMDDYPGFILSAWYDLGGRWDEEKKAWTLFGDCISDIDYSCRPVVRVGGGMNLVPLDRRSLYGDAEQSRFFVMSPAPGGTRLINELNGDSATPGGSHDVDKFDAYTIDAFAAGKYRGFSLYNEWWVRDLNNFHTPHDGNNQIVYTVPGGTALFPNSALVDYGSVLQGGYFVVPRKLELVARWSFVRGESGDILGQNTFHTTSVPGVKGPVRVYDGAFSHDSEADEYTVGVNYFFKRHLLKWQTDFGVYQGGNPAANAFGIAGFVPGIEGYLVRTQFQLAF